MSATRPGTADELPAARGSVSQIFEAPAEEISKPPSTLEIFSDRAFRRSTMIIAWFIVALIVWLVGSISADAMPAMRTYGLSFLTGSTWDANKGQFGILPAIQERCTARCSA